VVPVLISFLPAGPAVTTARQAPASMEEQPADVERQR
jgi:hypothetical protein